MSEAQKMILTMLSEGKISVSDAEKLLNSVKDDNESQTDQKRNQKYTRDDEQWARRVKDQDDKSSNPFKKAGDVIDPLLKAAKLGSEFQKLAKSMGKTIKNTVDKIEPTKEEIKGKIKEFGEWAQQASGIKDFSNKNFTNNKEDEDVTVIDPEECEPEYKEENASATEAEVERESEEPEEETLKDSFTILGVPFNEKRYLKYKIHNPFGNIKIEEGEIFKVTYDVASMPDIIKDEKPIQWFNKNGFKAEKGLLTVDISEALPADKVSKYDMKVTLPEHSVFSCITKAGDIKIHGKSLYFREITTESGDIELNHCLNHEKDSIITTQTGDIEIEDFATYLNVKSSEGRILISNSHMSCLNAETDRNSITLKNCETRFTPGEETNCGFKIKSASGSIFIEDLEGEWKNIKASSKQGVITISDKNGLRELQKECEISSGKDGLEIELSTESGEIRIDMK